VDRWPVKWFQDEFKLDGATQCICCVISDCSGECGGVLSG
jgi:hypothetical protein